MGKREYYCLDCKKFVKVHILPWGTGFKVCAECLGNRIIELEKMNRKEFKKLAKKFRKTSKI